MNRRGATERATSCASGATSDTGTSLATDQIAYLGQPASAPKRLELRPEVAS